MRRRGWVAAEDATGRWWTLQVWDDGWVELPGSSRDLSDTRRQLRHLVPRLLAVLLLAAGAVWTGRLGVPVLPQLLGLGFLALLVLTRVQAGRFRRTDRAQRSGDREQASDARAAGHRLRVRAGRSAWRRARSSAELADALEGVRRVAAETISRVEVDVPADPAAPVVVSVWLHDGTWLGYRTPDRTAVRLFAPWSRGPVPG